MKAVAGNMCPRCHALMSEPHAVWCATLDNVIAVGNTTPLQAEIDRLRAELTEARKPDCRTCVYYYMPLRSCGARNGCTAGDAYSPASTPLRLYEKE